VTDSRLLRLASDDNVLIVLSELLSGDVLLIDDHSGVIDQDLPVGFKVAAVDLPVDEVVIRLGMPIGRTTGRSLVARWFTPTT